MISKLLLKKEKSVWVYPGEPTKASIPGLIDKHREIRIRGLLHSLRSRHPK